MKVIETIPDLRRDERAKPFWEQLNKSGMIRAAKLLVEQENVPKRCEGEYPTSWETARDLWTWMATFRVEPFDPPPGQEIKISVNTWKSIDGATRASASYALGKPVPAIVVDSPGEHRSAGVLVFNVIWQWEK